MCYAFFWKSPLSEGEHRLLEDVRLDANNHNARAYDPRGKTLVTRASLVAGLYEIGICPGFLLQVHSSLSRLGYVEGGAETVVDALLEAVAPDGTVMMPTFNHGAAEVFDLHTTPSRNGAVTEALRRRPTALRSLHPTHPYAAIGQDAASLVAGHLEVDTFDRASPLGKLADMGGYVLLLGVGMSANTAAHIGEWMGRVHCIGFNEFPRQVRMEDGTIVPAWSVIWRDGPCRIEWEPLEQRMRSRGLIQDGRIGDGEAYLMRALDVINTTYEMTHELCPSCPTMPGRRN
jgi:aminoglycoside 3-N-acetyltransferase